MGVVFCVLLMVVGCFVFLSLSWGSDWLLFGVVVVEVVKEGSELRRLALVVMLLLLVMPSSNRNAI